MTGIHRAGVLGSPIAHSLSPLLHSTAYAALGLPWRYDAYEVTGSELPAFVQACVDSPDIWAGLSLTMPLKEAILPLLDDATALARRVGAANTVLFDDGQLRGDNTDVPGMVQAITDAVEGSSFLDSSAWLADSVTLLGAGATARSAIAALTLLPHSSRQQVTIVARKPAAVQDMVDYADSWGVTAVPGRCRLDDITRDHQELWAADLVISTLPGTVWKPEFVPFPQVIFDAGQSAKAAGTIRSAPPPVLMDVAYDPWPTRLSHVWLKAQAPVATGADLLLWQAAGQVTAMTKKEAPVAAMRAALTDALTMRANDSTP